MSSVLDLHRERFRADPSDSQAFAALEEHHFLAGDWDQLSALYRHRLTATELRENPPARAKLLVRLGQVWAERCDQAERAIACYREALKGDPRCRPALSGLRRVHAARGQWDVALQIGEAESELPISPAERSEVQAELGAIWLDHLGDPQQALELFRVALEGDPAQRDALLGTARLLEAEGRVEEAAQALERAIEALRGPARAQAELALARLASGPLDDPERAGELIRRALTNDPRNPEAVEAMARHAADNEQWALLADLEEVRFELAPDAASRAEIALEAGLLFLESLANPKAARIWLVRAQELAPERPAVLEALADCEREHGDAAALAVHLERLAAVAGPETPAPVLIELASLRSATGDDDSALELLQRALAATPGETRVLEALSDTLARLGRAHELADLLERSEAGGEAARDALERAFRADPSKSGLAVALEQLYRKRQAWDALRDVLATAGREGPSSDRPRFLAGLGSVLTEHFSEPRQAARAFEAALALDPGYAEAHRGLQELARASGDEDALLRAYEAEADATGDRARLDFLVPELVSMHKQRGQLESAVRWMEHQLATAPEDKTILRECARLREDLGHDAELLSVLKRLDPVLDAPERAANRRRIARLHAGHGRVDPAIEALQSVLDLEPDDLESLESLVIQLERAKRLDELAGARWKLVERLVPPRRTQCLDELAHLLANRLGDLDGAIEALTLLAREEAGLQDVQDRLEGLLERAGRFEELSKRLLERARRLPSNSREAQHVLRRRADLLLDDLGRYEEAAAAYRELCYRDPTSPEAQAGLERAVRGTGDPTALAALLADQAESLDDPREREHRAYERAVLLEETLDLPQEAATAYAALAASAQPDVREEAERRVVAIFERTEAWDELRQHWEASLERSGERRDPALHERVARLCLDRLADSEGAIDHFEQAARLAPERVEPWRELARLYEQAGRGADLVTALEGEIATRPDPESELVLSGRAAELCARTLRDEERARSHYERVLQLDPTHSAASETLIHHWIGTGQAERAVGSLQARLAALDDEPRDDLGSWAERRTSLRLRIAELLAGELGHGEGAIAALEPGLSELGYRAAVAEPLAELYERAGHTDQLIELCRVAAYHAAADSERAGWLVRLGGTLQASGREHDAAEAYREALTHRPDDRDVQATLREIYRGRGEAQALAGLLEVELSHPGGSPEVTVRLELAGLCAGPLERPDDALIHLRRILQLEPSHGEALELALDLVERLAPQSAAAAPPLPGEADAQRDERGRKRAEAILELLDAAVGCTSATAKRAALLTRRARLLVHSLRRSERAISSYREALALEGAPREVGVELRALLEAEGQWNAVLDCIHQQAAGEDAEGRARLFVQAAAIARDRVSPDAALPWLERLRTLRPDDPGVSARIAEIHRQAKRPDALLRALEEEITLTSEAARRHALHLERARILETQLSHPAAAAGAIEAALRESGGDAGLLRRLDELYRKLRRHGDRVRVIEALIEAAPAEERGTLHVEAASLCSGPLADPRGAVAHLLSAVAAAPAGGPLRAELLRALGDTLESTGMRNAWVRCAEAELAALDANAPVFSERRRDLRRRLAEACERELARPDRALSHLRALADRELPTPATTGATAPPEERALLRLLRAEGSWVELERRLAGALELRPDDSEGWLELARLRDERLRSPTAAAAAYRCTLELRPGCTPALRGLRGAAERLGDWEEVTWTLERELADAAPEAPEARAALLRKLGDVCWQRLGSTTRATRSFAAAVEADPRDFVSLHSLQRLLEGMEDWRGALDLYESEVEVLGDAEPERRRAVWLRAAELARRSGEAERAVRAYGRAQALGPLPPGRQADLAALHRERGD
ncbi:MAG: tetratricopeptide repeat protein, partial [Myxococcota bacterium]